MPLPAPTLKHKHRPSTTYILQPCHRHLAQTVQKWNLHLAKWCDPLVITHPETGRKALFLSPGYTIDIDGMPHDEAQELLFTLYAHQGRDKFVYRHSWTEGMLTMWDNRAVVHAATGGYQGTGSPSPTRWRHLPARVVRRRSTRTARASRAVCRMPAPGMSAAVGHGCAPPARP